MNNVPDKLIGAYLEGTLDEAQAEALSRWVQASKDNALYLASLATLEHGLVKHTKMQSNSDILTELAKQEEMAEADTVTLVGQVDAPSTKVSAHDYAEAGRYLFEHALANKRLLYTAGSAIAAVLLIALSLVFVFSGGPDEPVGDPLADATLWDTPTPKHLPVVATLTDEVGAQWRSDDKPVPMPMGAQLVAFERYTLTHGFAEITTRRGAKALLQAPCTIELTDSDNAIRLHRGKLVGKCETPSSKGFIVHVPGMDVVDLGTVFGVEADANNGSTVMVIEGSVRAQPASESPRAFEPVVLVKDQARRITPQAGRLEAVALNEAPLFRQSRLHPYAEVVLESRPLAYWRFEEVNDGVIRNEIKPGVNDLKVHGTANLKADGIHGTAGSVFSDSEQNGFFLMDGSLDVLDQSDAFTASCWFWADEVNQGTLFSLFVAGLEDYKHVALLELQPDYDVSARGDSGWASQSIRGVHCDPPNRDGAKGTNIYSKTPYKLNQWQHVALVKDASRLIIYLNGELAWELPTGSDVHGKAQLAIGLTPLQLYTENTSDELLRPHTGLIDEFVLYDRPLAAKEIKAHWQAGQQPQRHP